MQPDNEFTLNNAWAARKVNALCSAFKVNLTDDALAMWVEAVLDIVGINEEVAHASFPGKLIRPGEWLFKTWMDQKARFPKPVQLRILYARYWKPADGIDPVSVDEDNA